MGISTRSNMFILHFEMFHFYSVPYIIVAYDKWNKSVVGFFLSGVRMISNTKTQNDRNISYKIFMKKKNNRNKEEFYV